MARIRRGVGSTALLAIVFGGAGGAAVAADRQAIVLHVQNLADVPERELSGAQAEVDRVFEDAGLEITWVDGPPAATAGGPSRHISILLLNITRDSQAGADGCALGIALASRSTAYVFFNRLVAAAGSRPVDLGTVLGRAIAHEVGHVLLPPGKHSRHGLMRAELDFGVANPARFSREEAATIRTVSADWSSRAAR